MTNFKVGDTVHWNITGNTYPVVKTLSYTAGWGRPVANPGEFTESFLNSGRTTGIFTKVKENTMNTLERIEALEAELEQLKESLKEEGAVVGVKYPPKFEVVDDGWMVSAYFDGDIAESDLSSHADDHNCFSEEVAEGYANAFYVMIALRRQRGAGYITEDGLGWCVAYNAGIQDYWLNTGTELFQLCPPFPTKELATKAADAVGRDKIKAAYKFLAGIKD